MGLWLRVTPEPPLPRKEACANFAAARAADLEQTAAAISSAETNAAALKGAGPQAANLGLRAPGNCP